MRNVLLVTFVSSLFGIEGKRKIAPNDSQRTEVTRSHKSLSPGSTVLRIAFSGHNFLNEKYGPVVPNSCPRIQNCPASSSTQSSAWQWQQLSTSSHPHGPAEGGLQRWTCAPTACSSQDHRKYFPRDLTGPSTLRFLLRVGSREGLPSMGVVSTQSLALQEHFLYKSTQSLQRKQSVTCHCCISRNSCQNSGSSAFFFPRIWALLDLPCLPVINSPSSHSPQQLFPNFVTFLGFLEGGDP